MHTPDMLSGNISSRFSPNDKDRRIITAIAAALETNPSKAMQLFVKKQRQISDYGYWFVLSTAYVNDATAAPLATWRRLLMSSRPHRAECLMKPNELAQFQQLPDTLTVYRSYSPEQTDWLSYSLDMETAAKFAVAKDTFTVQEYQINKADAIALFLRRGEHEILMLDPSKATYIQEFAVIRENPVTGEVC